MVGLGRHAIQVTRTIRGRKAMAEEPIFVAPLRRLELENSTMVGAGYDLIDVRISTDSHEPIEATFMLDSGLTTNLLTAPLLERLNISSEFGRFEGAALAGGPGKLRSTVLPLLEVLGLQENKSRFVGVWRWLARTVLIGLACLAARGSCLWWQSRTRRSGLHCAAITGNDRGAAREPRGQVWG